MARSAVPGITNQPGYRRAVRAMLATLLVAMIVPAAPAAVIEWGPSGNPHVVTSDLVIDPGDLLRILPGTEIRLDPDVGIWIRGRLSAIGTEASPILFTRNQADTNWKSVVLKNSPNNEIVHCIFEYSSTEPSLSPLYGGAVFLDNHATVEIRNSEVRNAAFEGLYAQGYSQLVVLDSHIHDCGSGGILTKWGSSGRVVGCEINHVGYSPPYREGARAFYRDGIEYTGDSPNALFHEIRNSYIHDVANDGVDLDLDIDAVISGNVIQDCGDKGISVAMGSRALVTNTVIHNCYWALGPQSGADVTMSGCTIVGGTYGVRAIIDDPGWPGATAQLTNVIVWGTTFSSVLHDAASSVVATYCDFEDAYPGAGNLSLDPLFVDAAIGNFELQPTSPCIDAGWSEPPAALIDIDGDPRVDDPDTPNTGGGTFDYFDIGAQEYLGAFTAVEAAGAVSVPAVEAVPNPAVNGKTALRVHLSRPDRVSVRIFDVAGRLIREVSGEPRPAGDQLIPVTTAGGRGFEPGVYFIRVEGEHVSAGTRFIVGR